MVLLAIIGTNVILLLFIQIPGAIAHRCSSIQMFLKISQIS